MHDSSSAPNQDGDSDSNNLDGSQDQLTFSGEAWIHLTNLQERERRQIGQDLHDIVQSGLIGLSFLIQRLIDVLSDEGDQPVGSQERENLLAIAARMATSLKESIEQVRLLSHGLVASLPSADLLPQALTELAARTDQLYQIECRFAWDQLAKISDTHVATQIFRIAQEGITNCIKHSGADRIDISLEQQQDGLLLLVSDNGRGVSDAAATPLDGSPGIMKSRANHIGAELTLESRSDGATLRCFWRRKENDPMAD